MKDRKKDEELTEAGFKVLRFTDDQVLTDLENVKKAIEEAVIEREMKLNLPHTPSRRGKKRKPKRMTQKLER